MQQNIVDAMRQHYFVNDACLRCEASLSGSLSGSLWSSLALSPALSGSLSGSLWLSLALSSSLWPSLALSGSLWLALWLSLAPSCSLLLSQALYCSPNLLTKSSFGSQGPCSARSSAAALQHFMLVWIGHWSCSLQKVKTE